MKNEDSEILILIVEDEPSIAEMLQNVLEDEGYRVVLAENGQVGLQQLAKFGLNIKLIMSDLMMPLMDGPEMLRQMQANPAFQHIPVVLMSASLILPDLTGVVYAEFLIKPFNFDNLLQTVISLIASE